MRLIEIRLLDGPSPYRLEPVVKLEVAVGRRRSWYGPREPAPYNLIRLGAAVSKREWPPEVETLRHWVARFRQAAGEGRTQGLVVHRSSDPGHWILTWPWSHADRAKAIADSALELAGRGIQHAARRDLTPRRRRLFDRLIARVRAAEGDPPAWIRDADRSLPIISISGTNGKSTTTRLITRILRLAGKHVGTTTSDGVLVDEAMVEPGDWTGPGGAKNILARSGLDVAVLETARGGIVLRGVGYESNEASILTNVTSDHLDLQGIHTLPELAEVKATICRITKPSGWVVLNADDRWVAGVARDVKAQVAYFTMHGDRSALVRRHVRKGGRGYLVRDGALGELEGTAGGERWRPFAKVSDVPIAFGGAARHNVANALAAAAGARAMGASIEDVGRGLVDFRPSMDAAPGRLNVFRKGDKLVIIDFAHNEAGLTVLLDVADAIAAGRRPITAIVGTAGDRPDDTLRGMGKIAAQRAQRVVIKESIHYLRGRSRESFVGEIAAGARAGGWRGEIPTYETEVGSLQGELDLPPTSPEPIVLLLTHDSRDDVFAELKARGFRPVDATSELAELIVSG